VYGRGNMNLVVTTLDGVTVANLAAVPLFPSPGVYPFRSYNLQSEKVTLKGTLTNFDEHLYMTKLWMFVRQLWLTRPQ